MILKKIFYMKWSFIFLGMILVLGACSSEPEHTEILPPLTASSASSASSVAKQQASESEVVAKIAASAASEPSSDIAAQILNSPQEQDILQTSRLAMQSITASEVAEFRRLQASAEAFSARGHADVNADLPSLPEACEQYYQRVSACFAKQSESEFLLEMNAQLKADLAREGTDEASCRLLNDSFHAVANNLACE